MSCVKNSSWNSDFSTKQLFVVCKETISKYKLSKQRFVAPLVSSSRRDSCIESLTYTTVGNKYSLSFYRDLSRRDRCS
jgi:hypothetical protein